MVKKHWKDNNEKKPKMDISEIRKSMGFSSSELLPQPKQFMDEYRERIKELRKRLNELVDRGI